MEKYEEVMTLINELSKDMTKAEYEELLSELASEIGTRLDVIEEEK